MGYIHILGIKLEVAGNEGSCRGISLKRDELHLHLKKISTIASVAK